MSIIHKGNKIASNAVTGDTLPIGTQVPFTSLTIPDNWLLCDGSAISRVDYSELFAVIGTSYGAGNGTTTFNLPNKKGRTSVGLDSSQTEFDTIGETGGAKTQALTVANLPAMGFTTGHFAYSDSLWTGINITHNYNIGNGTAGTNDEGTRGNINNGARHKYTWGSNTAHNNLQPYETDVWIIKAKQSSGVVATVVDDLTSTSTTNALSANQGKVINEKFSEYVLYNNTTGSNGTITLSDDVSNYEYIEIYYRNGDGYVDYKKVYSPNGKICSLNLSYYNTGIGHYQNWSGTVNILDTTITHTKDYYTSNSTTATAINYIYITRVVGYK